MKEIKGNLFDQKVDVVCITTNGSIKQDGRAIMGCGIAKQAAELFPELPLILGEKLQTFGNYLHYLKYYEDRGYTVCAFPVKNSWQDTKADLKLIEQSCKDLVESTMPEVIVALVRPGCGVGNLNWQTEVKPLLEKYLDDRFIIVSPEDE